MNNKQTLELETDLANCKGVESRLEREAKLLAKTSAELHDLHRTAELEDEVALTKAARLHTIQQVAQHQRPILHERFMEAKKALVQACDKFAKTYGLPRFLDLQTRALAKVEAELRPNYNNPANLRAAALASSALQELRPLRQKFIIGEKSLEEVMKRAEGLLASYAGLDAFEQQHLS